jgi:hypothetical protein
MGEITNAMPLVHRSILETLEESPPNGARSDREVNSALKCLSSWFSRGLFPEE